jgi:hypothetical protein
MAAKPRLRVRREPPRSGDVFDLQRRDRGLHVLGNGDRAGQIGIGQDNPKFFATVASNAIGASVNTLLKRLRDSN